MDGLEQVVVMEGYQGKEPWVLTWEALRQLGRDRADALKSELAGRVADGVPDDIATIVYTSGTTGPPKGVVQTHGNHVFMLKSSEQTLRVKEGDVHLLFLPLAHSFGRLESFAGVYRGLTTAFAESIDRLRENLPEIQPHFICSVPRVFEKVYAGILARADAEKGLKKKIFFWALGVGKKVSKLKQARQPVPSALAVQHRLADKLVFSKMRAALGGRLRFAVSGGAPLSKEIAEFFHAAGILILEGYGLTETCPSLTFNREDHFKFGTVGQAQPGVELKIAADGEILGRGPNIAKGYFKKPEATREVFLEDGWFATGDIGRFDDDGFLFERGWIDKRELDFDALRRRFLLGHVASFMVSCPYRAGSFELDRRRPPLAAPMEDEFRWISGIENVFAGFDYDLQGVSIELVVRFVDDEVHGLS